MSAALKLPPLAPKRGITVGVTELAWMYDRTRGWAKALLERWEREEKLGQGPVRTMRVGKILYTTMPVVHANMPPGKDLALYRRVEAVESSVDDAHSRINRLSSDQSMLTKRVTSLELRRR